MNKYFFSYCLFLITKVVISQQHTEEITYHYVYKNDKKFLEEIIKKKYSYEILTEESGYNSDSSLIYTNTYIYDTISKHLIQGEKENIRELVKKYDTIESSVFLVETKKSETPLFGQYESITFYNEIGKMIKEINFNRLQIPTYKTVYQFDDSGCLTKKLEFAFELGKGFMPIE